MPSPAQDYEVLFTIGSGSYGKCQKIRRKSDGKLLVWKELDYGTMGDREKQMLVSEVNLLRDLRHPNIVRYHDRIIDRSNTTLYIVMEYCEGGDLSNVIAGCIKEKHYLEERFVLRVMAQLALALKECHTRSDGGVTVLHRDLKPANVFLDAKQNVKLGDFGLARILNHDTSFAKTFVGTPYYMSPEQVNRLSYNEKSDIWSLGCLLYELCALMPPFNAYNQQDLAEKIREGKFRRIPYRYSDELNSLLSRMLNVKDYQRPSVDAILDNNLLAEVIIKEPGFLLRRNGPDEQRKVKGCRRSDEGAARPLQKPVEAAPVSTAELRMKEKLLRDRETALKEREERLERREKELCVREQMLDEKMTRAENILKNYNHKQPTKQRKALAPYFPDLSDIDVEERLSPSPGKKKVHFAGDSKENHRSDRHELNLKKTHIYIPTLDEVERTYTFKSRQLLGIR